LFYEREPLFSLEAFQDAKEEKNLMDDLNIFEFSCGGIFGKKDKLT